MQRYDSCGEGELYPNLLFSVINTEHGLNKSIYLGRNPSRRARGKGPIVGRSAFSSQVVALLRTSMCSGHTCPPLLPNVEFLIGLDNLIEDVDDGELNDEYNIFNTLN
jgi:hypothetical protein